VSCRCLEVAWWLVLGAPGWYCWVVVRSRFRRRGRRKRVRPAVQEGVVLLNADRDQRSIQWKKRLMWCAAVRRVCVVVDATEGGTIRAGMLFSGCFYCECSKLIRDRSVESVLRQSERKGIIKYKVKQRRRETPGSERRESRDGAGLGVWQRLRGLRSPEKQHPHPWKIDQARKRNKYLEIATIDRGWSWKGRAAPSNWVSGITALHTRITADVTAVPR
jgi:hypothetical protein